MRPEPSLPRAISARHLCAGRDARWLLETRAATHGDKPALIWEPFRGAPCEWTYQALMRDVDRTAAGLAARGVGAGDHVLIHLGNCPEFVLAWHACAALGAVAVTTNTRATEDELAHYIAISQPAAAVTQPKFVDMVGSLAPSLRCLAVTATDCGRPAAPGERRGALPFADLACGGGRGVPRRPPDPYRPCSVQFTSGTTARPKGVVWTHGNVLWGAKMTCMHLGLTDADVSLVHFPLFHTNALMYAHLASLFAGAAIVLRPAFAANTFWEVACRRGCTWTSTSPLIIHALQRVPPAAQHRFRFWGTGVNDLPACEAFRVKSLGWWAMTETVTFGLVAECQMPQRPLAVGRPVPGLEIAIVQADGSMTPSGEVGRLLVRGVRGVSLFAEYLNDQTATRAAFDDEGWFDTGDMVRPFDDGEVQFEGRAKDMLRVGGENVSAAEIERVVMTVPGVGEVAVVGKPDPIFEEIPIAFVVPLDGRPSLQTDITDACRRLLSDFKQPRAVVLMRDFPRSTLNKVAKNRLRELTPQIVCDW